MSKELGIDEIKQIIPHRFPMLLIDRVLFLKVGQEAKAVHNVSFGGIKEANFIVQARPGDQIVLTTKLTKIRKNIGIGIGEAWVGNKKIAQAELTFMIG